MWYYQDEGKMRGPIKDEFAKKMVANGLIGPETLVSRDPDETPLQASNSDLALLLEDKAESDRVRASDPNAPVDGVRVLAIFAVVGTVIGSIALKLFAARSGVFFPLFVLFAPAVLILGVGAIINPWLWIALGEHGKLAPPGTRLIAAILASVGLIIGGVLLSYFAGNPLAQLF